MVAFAGYPLVVGERLVGVMSMFARRPLTESALELLASVANGVALGIEQRRSADALREQREIIETVSRLGQVLSAELDLRKLVQALTDAATEITSARFGSFLYNVLDDRGASYTLYTLSGVPCEHFAQFPMPRATDFFGPTFRGEGVIRIGDVKREPRYGKNSPYFGMPEGHLPVTSYLGVPVVSRSGEVLGGPFDVLRDWAPDLIISDVAMPGQDGYQFIRRVRSLTPERGGRAPAIALTAYARSEDRVKAMRAGFDMHIPKPVEPAELIAAVARLASRRENPGDAGND